MEKNSKKICPHTRARHVCVCVCVLYVLYIYNIMNTGRGAYNINTRIIHWSGCVRLCARWEYIIHTYGCCILCVRSTEGKKVVGIYTTR